MNQDTTLKQENCVKVETPKNPKNQPAESQPKDVTFWMFDQKLLTLNLLECESLWEIKTSLVTHPLPMLFPNFKFTLEGKSISLGQTLSEFLKNEGIQEPEDTYRVDLIPENMSIQDARKSLLALIKLIQNPESFLANQMMRFYDIIGKPTFFARALENLSFSCEDVPLEETLEASLHNSQQVLKIEKMESGDEGLSLSKSKETKVRELEFLRRLVLPEDSQQNLQGFEEYFEVLVETMEHTLLGFVFSKRGVYLSRRIKREGAGDSVSLHLLSLPREHRKRLTGFFPGLIPLLMQESPSFAERFQQFVDKDLPGAEAAGVSLLLNFSFSDVRNGYKHWISSGLSDLNKIQGEGTFFIFPGEFIKRTSTSNVNFVCVGKTNSGKTGTGTISYSEVPQ